MGWKRPLRSLLHLVKIHRAWKLLIMKMQMTRSDLKREKKIVKELPGLTGEVFKQMSTSHNQFETGIDFYINSTGT